MSKSSDFTKIILKPLSQRIIQFFIKSKTATVSELAFSLTDIPRATLYRAVNSLLRVNALKVVSEKQLRGAVEKTYELCEEPFKLDGENTAESLISNTLYGIMTSFGKFFSSGGDPQKEMLSVTMATFMLTDNEFIEFYNKISKIYSEYIENKPGEGRKQRKICFVSAPIEDIKGE